MLDRLLGNYMLDRGLVTKGQLGHAYRIQEEKRAKLGVIAVSERLMTIAQAEQVNALQATMDKRFGDIAIEKGYLTQEQLGRLLELQGNSYLAFIQVLVDEGLLSMEQVNTAETDYQQLLGLTGTDMTILKTGDIDKIIPIFLESDDERTRKMFAMCVKNLYRLVDSHVFVGKAYRTGSIRDEVMAYQCFYGDENAYVAIAGKYEDIQKVAVNYTKEEFIETKEDALDAICELINCMNGLYASDISRDGIRVEMEPPEFSVVYTEARAEDIIVMPVYLSGGSVKLFISLSIDMTIK